MVETPGFLSITADDYHADLVSDGQPALSASIAHVLVNASPAHAKAAHPKLNPNFERAEEQKFDVGTVAHALMLQGERDADEIVEIVFANDWKTKAAQQAREEARDAGRIPLLSKHWQAVSAMVDAGREQLRGFDVDPRPFTDGKAEQTIVWSEPNGVCCKARIDWLHDDLSAIDDLKTTSRSADPDAFSRSMWSMGNATQAAFYRRGIQALCGRAPEFRFVVIETYPPYCVSVVSMAPDALALADAKVGYAIDLWAECLERNKWPAYPTRTVYVNAPPWEESRWLEREAREEISA